MTDPFGPARLGPVSLRNRVLKAATFEGMSRIPSSYSGTRCVLDHPDPLIAH